MKVLKVFFLFFIVVFLNSCKENEFYENAEIIKIDPSEAADINFCDYLEINDVIRLKQHEEQPLGQVNKIFMDRSNIYVLDRMFSKALFKYEINNGTVKVITKQGRGPGESLGVNDFYIDKQKKQITIISANPGKQINFNMAGGFINEENLMYSPSFFSKDTDGKWLYELSPRSDNFYRVTHLDLNCFHLQ